MIERPEIADGISPILPPLTDPPIQNGAAARYARAAFYSISGAVLGRLIVFFQGVFIARHLGVELFGVFSVVTGAATLVTSFAGFSLGFALTKFLPEHLTTNPKRAENILLHCLLTAMASAIFLSMTFFLLAPLLANRVYHRIDLVGYFRLSSLMVLVLAIFNIAGAILIGFQRFREYAWRMSAGYACQFIAVWVGGTLLSLPGILIGLVVGPVIAAAILLQGGSEAAREHGVRIHWKEFKWSRPVMRSILSFSVPSQIAGLIATPVLWIISTILTLKKGFAEVGLFSVAFVFFQVVLFFAQNFSLPALPVLSEIQATGDRNRFNRALNKNLRASWAVTLPLCFLLTALGRTIVLLVYGQKYEAAGAMILFTSFGALWFVMFYALFLAITSLGKMWDLLFLNIVWTAIVLALGWTLSGSYGSMGMAAAYFISYFILAMITFPYSAWRLGFRFTGVFRMVLFSLVAIAIAYVISFRTSPHASWILSALLGPAIILAEWKWMLEEDDHDFIKSFAQSFKLRFSPRG